MYAIFLRRCQILDEYYCSIAKQRREYAEKYSLVLKM